MDRRSHPAPGWKPRAAAALTCVVLAGPIGSEPLAATGDPRPATGALEYSLPPRPADAPTGSEFARRTAKLAGRQRQARGVEELVRGNFPDFLRRLVPVRVGGDAEGPALTFWTLPDYLAVGSDDDFLRFPLTYPAAVSVADRLGFVLPTSKMVDAIHAAAEVRLAPRPLPPGPAMRSTDYYLRHHRLIEEQLGAAGHGALVAGHKKDVVLTRRLASRRGRIAIYGWHRRAGGAIQPLSLVHGGRYADYSHGVRLVFPWAEAAGERRAVLELLADSRWAPLLSREGGIPDAARLLHPASVAAANP